MSTRTRRGSAVLAVLTVVAVLLAGCTHNADAWNSAVMVNTERQSRGLHDLQLHGDLVDKAQAWAEQMAVWGRVRHSDLGSGVGPGWRILGENVGWARSVEEMHSMFMRSSGHRRQIVDGRYTHFGVGVAVANGRFYTVQVFAG